MKILMAIDGCPGCQHALGEALEQAWPADASFEVLHVAPESPHQEARVVALNEAVFAIKERGWSATAHVRHGDARAGILDFADEIRADLIVVGSRRPSVISRFLLGSVSAAVLRHAKCSVQIVRPRPHDFRAVSSYRVLLATDGSEYSRRAARVIAARPWQSGTELCIVSAVELLLPPTLTLRMPGDPDFAPDQGEFEAAKSLARRAIREAGELVNGVFPRYAEAVPFVSRGPKRAILEEAQRWEADCIFLGSHGLQGMDRFLLGSVSESVAVYAHCSVEVVR